MKTYRVEIINKTADMLSGRVGQKLEQAMKLVADEMNAANTGTSTIRVIGEMDDEVVFSVARDGGEWKT